MYIGISYVNVCLIWLSGLMTASHHIRVYRWIIYNTECCVILLTSNLRHALRIDSNYSNITKLCGFLQKKILKNVFFQKRPKTCSILVKNLTIIQPTQICNSSSTNKILLLNSDFNYLILI